LVPFSGNFETGGLLSRELFYLIYRINKMKNLRAIDIVEINSEKDFWAVQIGAKILAELL